MPSLRRLLIVSHVIHYRHDGRLYAYGPYAREIDKWADVFPEVVIAAPCRNEQPYGDCIPFSKSNISIAPQKETGGTTWTAKVRQVIALPVLILGLGLAMRRVDAIHVRCPGNLGLLGVILAPLFSRRLVAKYAGQWNSFPGEPRSWRLQKAILRSRWWRGPVTVYGEWPNQPSHVVPFFTSILTADQVNDAREAAARQSFSSPLRVLFVGRLSKAKNVDVLIAAIGELAAGDTPLECTIVGDGPERQALEEQVEGLGLGDRVHFAGNMAFESVLDYYKRVDVLVLASETEGWPKALAEGMAFGLVCIGSDRGLVPWMLSDGRGLTVPPGNVRSLTKTLEKIARAPEDCQSMRERAAAWAQEYSLEGLGDALRKLLSEHWGLVSGTCDSVSTQTSNSRV